MCTEASQHTSHRAFESLFARCVDVRSHQCPKTTETDRRRRRFCEFHLYFRLTTRSAESETGRHGKRCALATAGGTRNVRSEPRRPEQQWVSRLCARRRRRDDGDNLLGERTAGMRARFLCENRISCARVMTLLFGVSRAEDSSVSDEK